MDLPLTIASKPIDLEITDLLGEKTTDFIILYLDGNKMERFGTPYDTPANRSHRQLVVDALNDRSEKSLWPEFFANWKSQLCRQYELAPETTAEDWHPVASLAIHRVCVGYSEYPHAAFGLFEKIADRLHEWQMSGIGGRFSVRLVARDGRRYSSEGQEQAEAICDAVVRLLRDMQNA